MIHKFTLKRLLLCFVLLTLAIAMFCDQAYAETTSSPSQGLTGREIKPITTDAQKIRALQNLAPPQPAWRAKESRSLPRSTKTATATTDMFFDLDREITVDTELVKGSAGLQVKW